MMLSDGDPAEDGDIWFRILTSDKHITKGRVQHAAFKGAIKPPRPEKNRSWSSEMSGRLRSIAGTITEVQQHAIQYCDRKNQTFAGVAFSSSSRLRISFQDDPITSAVYYTPIDKPPDTDSAHADLVFIGPAVQPKSAEEERLILTLHGLFTGLHPAQLHLLPPASIPTADTWCC
jgi:hypothetical protein